MNRNTTIVGSNTLLSQNFSTKKDSLYIKDTFCVSLHIANSGYNRLILIGYGDCYLELRVYVPLLCAVKKICVMQLILSVNSRWH